MLIRHIQREDAKQLLQLQLQLDQETQFMLREQGERSTSIEEQRQHIDFVLTRGGMIFVAEHDGQIVGHLGATIYAFRRVRHSATIVIGIIQEWTRRGVGNSLFTAMEEWAQQKHLHRLELTVMTNNTAGIALYKKRGFQIEGMRKDAYLVNDRYIDEYSMAKLL